MTTWTPFRNYSNTYHVLGATPCFAHQNGNVYFSACEKVDGQHQNLVVYRYVAATGAWETVVSFIDGDASQGFIERGGCVVAPDGALWVATSLQPKGVPYDPQKRTGYEGVWCRIPNVDQPYVSTAVLLSRIAALEATLAALPPTTTGPVVTIPARSAEAGGRIQLSDGQGGVWFFDVYQGGLRVVQQKAGASGVVKERWD